MFDPMTKSPAEGLPLCLDLDGTIIKSDVAIGLNAALCRARGEIIVRVDGHTIKTMALKLGPMGARAVAHCRLPLKLANP